MYTFFLFFFFCFHLHTFTSTRFRFHFYMPGKVQIIFQLDDKKAEFRCCSQYRLSINHVTLDRELFLDGTWLMFAGVMLQMVLAGMLTKPIREKEMSRKEEGHKVTQTSVPQQKQKEASNAGAGWPIRIAIIRIWITVIMLIIQLHSAITDQKVTKIQ